MREHAKQFGLAAMCRVLRAHRSGYYAWLRIPHSPRSIENQRLSALIKQAWLESGAVYGYRKVATELRDQGERCSKHRVARLMKAASLKAQVGYRRYTYKHGGKLAAAAPNHLKREFAVARPNTHWVTDITYLCAHEGRLFLAVVLDLYSRQVVGGSMQTSMHSDLVLQALLAAVWRRKPPTGLMLHSDQGTQYTSNESQSLLISHPWFAA